MARPPRRASAPAIPGSTTASIAEARIGIARSMPQKLWARSTSDGSTVSVPGARETSSKPYVGRIVSTFEWKTRRCAGPDASVVEEIPLRSITCSPCSAGRSISRRPSLPARQLRLPEVGPGAFPIESQLEPAGSLGIGQVVADPLDRRPIARPDDLLVCLVDLVPVRVVMLVREAWFGVRPQTHGED